MGTLHTPLDPQRTTLALRSNKDAAVDFMTLVCSGHVRQAYAQYVDRSFKHHNPLFAPGANALMIAMDDNAKEHPQKALTVHHVIAEGDLVALHALLEHDPDERGFALAHVFRFKDGKIVEMWDLAQEVPSESRNTDGMF